jgi:drug/metabolite transporter (DMT)-like permease
MVHVVVVHVAYAFTQVLYGCLYVVINVTVGVGPGLNAFVFAGLRLAFALLTSLALVLLSREALASIKNIDRRQLALLLACSVAAATTQMLTAVGVQRAGASFAALLQPFVPCLCLAIECFILRQLKMTFLRALGLVLAVAGVLVLVRVWDRRVLSDQTVGMLCLVVSMFFVAVGVTCQRALCTTAGFPPVAACCGTFLLAAAAVGPVAGWFVNDVDFGALRWTAWLGILFCGVVVNAATEVIAFWSLRRMSAATATSYIVLQPITASLLAFFILHEPFGWAQGVGGALCVAGLASVLVATARENKSAQRRQLPINRADE